MIICIIGISLGAVFFLIPRLIRKRPRDEEILRPHNQFVVSEYYSRIERASLDILERKEFIDQTITLWWGIDGLRLNEDGSLEWVRRRDPPAKTVFYQPYQSIGPVQTGPFLMDQSQCVSAQINELMARNAALQMQTMEMQNQFGMSMPLGHPFCGSGLVGDGYAQLLLTQCCCEVKKTKGRCEMRGCKYVQMVDCQDPSQCASCGWCPEVSRQRLAQLRSAQSTKRHIAQRLREYQAEYSQRCETPLAIQIGGQVNEDLLRDISAGYLPWIPEADWMRIEKVLDKIMEEG